MAIGISVLAAVLFAVFALPQIVDLFFYRPDKTVAVGEYDSKIDQMSIDLGVYTELFFPGGYRDGAEIQSHGFGRYSLFLPGNPTVAGELNRNELTLYTPEAMNRYPSNAFYHDLVGVEDYFLGEYGLAGTAAQARAAADQLPTGTDFLAFYTLDQVMDYDAFVKWFTENGVRPEWCALCVSARQGSGDTKYAYQNLFSYSNIGLNLFQSCQLLTYNQNKYPLLTQGELIETTDPEDEGIPSAEAAQQHVVSMLRYMHDHPKFFSIMRIEETYEDEFAKAADRIEEQGLLIYGFTVRAQKEEIIRIADTAHVAYVYTDQVK